MNKSFCETCAGRLGRLLMAPAMGLALGLCLVATPAAAQAEAPATPAAVPAPSVTNPVFQVTRFNIEFDKSAEGAGLDADTIKQQPIRLAKVGDVYTRPQPGAELVSLSLAQLGSDEAKGYDVTALRTVIDTLLAYLGESEDLVGIIVAPSPQDIGLDLSDRRENRTELSIVIRLAKVGRVRSLASGDRIDPEQREDHPLHDGVREASPLQGAEQPGEGSFIRRGELDDYLHRLNRHPGRRVDAAISPGLRPGEVSLDYLVAENKPWYVYFQISNTGTDSTDEIRERFGFVHNQLTGADDVLSIDYITTGFEDSHVLQLNYTRPLNERLEVRFNSLYSDFTADQVGSPLNFNGEDFAAGATLAYNFFQRGPLFVDAVAGLEYYYTSAENELAATEGEANFLLGSAGLELERVTDLSRVYGQFLLRGSLNQESSATDLANLGRTNPDSQFMFLQYALSTSLYLEPLLNPTGFQDISDPSTSTLAHELALLLRGQWAVADDRLVPTFQTVAGGLNTVRGYEEAHVAGDNSFIVTAEYRFHVPRVFGIQAPRQTRLFDRPFRLAPDSVYGRPDWDLVLKAFVDYAHVDTSDRVIGETSESLLGSGVGVELALKNNVNLRADWGVALKDAGTTQSGHNRFHLILTLLY